MAVCTPAKRGQHLRRWVWGDARSPAQGLTRGAGPRLSALGASGLASWMVLILSGSIFGSFRAAPFELIVVMVGVVLVVEHRREGLGLFAPWTAFSSAYAVMFGLVPLADLWYRNPAADASAWTLCAWVSGLVYLLTYCGYVLARRAGGRPASKDVVWSPWAARLIASGLLALAVGAVTREVLGAGGASVYLAHFANRSSVLPQSVTTLKLVTLATPAVLLVAANFLNRPNLERGATLLGIWILPALLASAYWGQRWRDLALIVALLALFHKGVRKLPAVVLAALVGTLLALFVSVALVRDVVGTGHAARSISGANFYNNYLASNEIGQFRAFVTTVQGTPSVLAYQHGATFLSVIPGNAFPTGGHVFTTTFYPVLASYGVTYANSLPGELYMNFGWVGVLVGMPLLGLLLGWLERYERTRGSRLGPLLVYAYSIVPVAGLLRGDFTTFAGYSAIALVPLLIACWFAERPRRRADLPERSPGISGAS